MKTSELCEVGFYNTVTDDERTIHVETEVTVGDKIEITTKTWVDGTVDDKIVQIFELPEENVLLQLKAAAEIQHNRAHQKARQRKN